MATVNGGTAGFVCDDSFTWYSARAACKHLGFVPGRASILFATQQSIDVTSRTFALDNVACSSSAERLDDCSFLTSHNCGNQEGVQLNCEPTAAESISWEVALTDSSGNPQSGASAGILAIRTTGSSDSWEPVCYMGFDESAAAAACNALGYSTGSYKLEITSTSTSPSSFGSSPTVSDLTCQAGSTDLTGGGADACSWLRIGEATTAADDDCPTSTYLQCDATSIGLPTGVEFELAQQDGLSQSSGTTSGYLVATVGSTRGFVCDDSFSSVSAAVVCRQLFGFYLGGVTLLETSRTIDMSGGTGGPTDFSMDNFACSSS